MTQNDNFKYYYGQSLINKDTVSEYESILDYIKANGGSGSGIDADLLDGKDSNEFLLREDQDLYMSPGFYIGFTPIIDQKESNLQFLYTRDIKLNGEYLYMFKGAGDNLLRIEQLYEEYLGSKGNTILNSAQLNYTHGDWVRDHTDQLLEAGLYDIELAIRCLFEYIENIKDDLDEDIDLLKENLLDEDTSSKIHYIIDNYLVNFKTYDNEGNLTNNVEPVLDAGAVNGLRFFLVTQQQYDQYPDPIKEDPRYIFIIKDNVPEGYVTPTTISASSLKLLFKSEDGKVKVSIDGGATYYDAGNLYQFTSDEEDEGLLPMYISGESLPTILADPNKLGDNFFINGAWMRNFLGTDPDASRVGTLDDILNDKLGRLKEQMMDELESALDLDNTYELKENKNTGPLTNSSNVQYPSTGAVLTITDDLKARIDDLDNKIGQIDLILTRILGTGNND